MKKILAILMIGALLPASAFAGKKKQDSTPQDATDWLNAPTPDGSPTLKETSDWLAQTLAGYGGNNFETQTTVLYDIGITNDCNFHFTMKTTDRDTKHWFNSSDVSIPLGAVTSVEPYADPDTGRNTDVTIHTGNVEAMQFVSHGWQNKGTNSGNQIFIPVEHRPGAQPGAEVPQSPAQMVPRIVTALEHAASLCRSVYKAPVQTKQPF